MGRPISPTMPFINSIFSLPRFWRWKKRKKLLLLRLLKSNWIMTKRKERELKGNPEEGTEMTVPSFGTVFMGTFFCLVGN